MAKAKKKVSTKRRLSDSHAGHANHMCAVVGTRQMAKAGRLAKGAKHICAICGRAAAKATNLCEPVEI